MTRLAAAASRQLRWERRHCVGPFVGIGDAHLFHGPQSLPPPTGEQFYVVFGDRINMSTYLLPAEETKGVDRSLCSRATRVFRVAAAQPWAIVPLPSSAGPALTLNSDRDAHDVR